MCLSRERMWIQWGAEKAILKNRQLKVKKILFLRHRRGFPAFWMCVPCHECCIIWISSLCLPLRTRHCIPTTLFQPQQKEAAGSEFFWSTSRDIRLTCSGVIRCFLFLINCAEISFHPARLAWTQLKPSVTRVKYVYMFKINIQRHIFEQIRQGCSYWTQRPLLHRVRASEDTSAPHSREKSLNFLSILDQQSSYCFSRNSFTGFSAGRNADSRHVSVLSVVSWCTDFPSRANPQNLTKVFSSDLSELAAVFRASTPLWSLSVLQHWTLKQPAHFFFQVSRSFKKTPLSENGFETFNSTGITADP